MQLQVPLTQPSEDTNLQEMSMEEFVTKDSGERVSFSTGMVRDVQKGKARFDLVWKPLLWRWAELMGRGADKYGENNWMKAQTEEELNRFKGSAERHLQQLLRGDTDEDHGAAVCFNIAGIEYTKERIKTIEQEIALEKD